MTTRQLLLAAGLLLLSTGAQAFHCPMDMKKIDEALGRNPTLSSQQLDEVKKLRAEGDRLHQAGKHQEAVDTLARAMKILGI